MAANDDLFPISTSDSQVNESGSPDYLEGNPPGTEPVFAYAPPYNGPSHLRFNAIGGVTYYFMVDTKANSFPSTGPVILNWAYQSSGVFRFATENFDLFTGLPLYETSQTESAGLSGTSDDVNSAVLTYYTYNVPGVLVTVTRAAGSVGRALVSYTTVNGDQISFPQTDLPGYDLYTNITYFTNLDGSPGTNKFGAPLPPTVNIFAGDYTPVTNTLVFDDFEMSKTILIPITSSGGEVANPLIRTNVAINGNPINLGKQLNNISNMVFGVELSNPQPDPLESSEVSFPRVDPSFSTAMVRILNTGADPYGPDLVPTGHYQHDDWSEHKSSAAVGHQFHLYHQPGGGGISDQFRI